MIAGMKNILTIDVEEWYHAEYVKDGVHRDKEDFALGKVTEAMHLLQDHGVDATFFVVGELAERYPDLTNRIRERGHEVAFHGFYHTPLWKAAAETFKLEVNRFNAIIGHSCRGFRAPSFSLSNETRWVLELLKETGFQYDSSIFPVETPLYGVRGAPLKPYKPSQDNIAVEDESAKLWEFPLLVYPLTCLRLPVAGGFYLRFLPVSVIMKAVSRANKHGYPAVLYFHTWELDARTPRVKLNPYRSFVTYHNLEKAKAKLQRILSCFEFTSIKNYMEEMGLA